jgi:hypothetical protein
MDAGLSIKPPATNVLQTSVVQSASAQVQHAVESGLPAAKSVAAPQRDDAPRAENLFVIIDPQSREVIFRVIDVRSRQVLRQVPDEALLRLSAYARTIADGSSATDVEHQADLQT